MEMNVLLSCLYALGLCATVILIFKLILIDFV